MRLLLSFILIAVFFIAPSKSNAVPVFEKEAANVIAHNFYCSDAADYSEYRHQTATVFHRVGFRHSSQQHKWNPGIQPDHSKAALAPAERLLAASLLGNRYFHFTPIAHKLLFPKHFFW